MNSIQLTTPAFRAPKGLSNRHAQTLLSSSILRKRFLPRAIRGLQKSREEWLLDTHSGAKLHGFYYRGSPQTRRVAILLHGWEGCADSIYMLHAAHHLLQAGYHVFTLHLRDHGPSLHLNRELFHACRLDEVVESVDQVVEQLKPQAERFFLAGFSLGGNFTLRITQALPDAFEAVAAVSPVFKPDQTVHAIDHGWLLYKKYFLALWKSSLLEKSTLFPGLVDEQRVRGSQSIYELTQYLVEYHTEFASADDYFKGYALHQDQLEALTTPAKILVAKDDPVIPFAPFARLSTTKALKLESTPHGGHCGFIVNWRLETYAEKAITDWFAQHP